MRLGQRDYFRSPGGLWAPAFGIVASSRQGGAAPLSVRCSDAFSAVGLTVGKSTDNGLGGTVSDVWLSSYKQGGSNVHTETGTQDQCVGSYDQVAVTDTGVARQRSTITTASIAASGYPKVFIRWSTGTGEGYYYAAYCNGGAGNLIVLQRMVNGTGTDLASASSWNNGDTIDIGDDGSKHLTVRKNGLSVITFDDSGNGSVGAGVGGFGNQAFFTGFIWET